MNAAFLLLGAAIATPLAAFEVRRKWLDWRRAQQPFRGTPLHDGVMPYEPKAVPRITRHITTPSPVDVRDGVWHHPSGATYWVGLDLASADDLCVVHDGNGYVVDISRAPGNFENFPPSEDTSAGAGE